MVKSSITDSPLSRKAVRRRRQRWIALLAILVPALVYLGTRWQDHTLHRALRHLADGEPDRALVRVREYLSEHPRHSRARAIEGRSLAALERWEEAAAVFDEVGAASEDELAAWGEALVHLQRWEQGRHVLGRLLELEPNHPDGLYHWTACNFHLGYYDRALEGAQRLAALPGREARGFVVLGTLQRDLQQRPSAIESWEKALAFTDQDLPVTRAEVLQALGTALLEEGQTEAALHRLEESVALAPSVPAYYSLGEAHLQLGDPGEADQHWMQVLEMDPLHREAREALARASLNRGLAQECLDWIEPILRESGKARSSTTYLLEQAFVALDDEEAAALWRERTEELRRQESRAVKVEQVLRDAPQSYWGRALRAHGFAAAGNWEAAAPLVQALVQEGDAPPFVAQLAEAVRVRGPLPGFDLLPIDDF